MPTYAALLRAVNVGGTGKLAMSELKALCEACGFAEVVTYIQSGNVVFTTNLGEKKAQAALASALEKQLKKPVGVLVRSVNELRALDSANPFPEAEPQRVIVFFFDEALAAEKIAAVKTPGGERLVSRGRELFVHYPDGQGKSKLKVPGAELGTGRNLNTVRKLVELGGGA